MKYYIATALERAADHNLVRDAMAAAGHQITYDWTAHGSVQSEGLDRIREVAELETRGVLDADLVIVLLPGGRGTHAELGIAIGAGIPILLHAEDEGLLSGSNGRTCAFYHHKLVTAAAGGRLPAEICKIADFVLYYSTHVPDEAPSVLAVSAGGSGGGAGGGFASVPAGKSVSSGTGVAFGSQLAAGIASGPGVPGGGGGRGVTHTRSDGGPPLSSLDEDGLRALDRALREARGGDPDPLTVDQLRADVERLQTEVYDLRVALLALSRRVDALGPAGQR